MLSKANVDRSLVRYLGDEFDAWLMFNVNVQCLVNVDVRRLV